MKGELHNLIAFISHPSFGRTDAEFKHLMTPGFRESRLTDASHSLYLASEFPEHQGDRVARAGGRGHAVESPSPLLAVPDILALFCEPHFPHAQ